MQMYVEFRSVKKKKTILNFISHPLTFRPILPSVNFVNCQFSGGWGAIVYIGGKNK